MFSILLAFSVFLLMALVRLAIRKVTRCEMNGAEATKSIFQNKYIDLLTIYIFFSFIIIVIWGFIAFWITE